MHQETKLLDHGFIRLVDQMGSDAAIEAAARQSYGEGTRPTSDRRNLLRYLMRHHHWTPFEMCEMVFQVKCPIFVQRQWIRHRTASVNEYSARYSKIMNDFYIPEPAQVCYQSSDNKQGRNGEVDDITQQCFQAYSRRHRDEVIRMYDKYADEGVAREIARINVPVSNYTMFTWKCDLRNIFNFLNLRTDPHAQYEIRVYAEAMAEYVKQAFPIAYEAFDDYIRQAVYFSKAEKGVLASMLCGGTMPEDDSLSSIMSAREVAEFKAKLDKMGVKYVKGQQDCEFSTA